MSSVRGDKQQLGLWSEMNSCLIFNDSKINLEGYDDQCITSTLDSSIICIVRLFHRSVMHHSKAK